jgi:hypothetical protein
MTTTVTKTARTIEAHATDVCVYGRMGCLFQSKETRDAVAKWLKAKGIKTKKGTSRGQQLHPEFVQDFVGTYETGFGNADYQTRWGTLYRLSLPQPGE